LLPQRYDRAKRQRRCRRASPAGGQKTAVAGSGTPVVRTIADVLSVKETQKVIWPLSLIASRPSSKLLTVLPQSVGPGE
jgi:hypothetical protein